MTATYLYNVMQLTAYSSTQALNSHSTSKKFTEATTTILQDHIYTGVGPRYLGWQFPEFEELENNTLRQTKRAGPRSWKMPPKEELKK